jgi:hypothetical protein
MNALIRINSSASESWCLECGGATPGIAPVAMSFLQLATWQARSIRRL